MPAPAKACAVLVAAALAAAAGGCGQSPQEAARERERAADQQRLREKAAGLEDEIKQLLAQQSQVAPTTTTGQGTESPAKRPARNCGAGVAAGPGTSCDFALNTAQEWVDTSGGAVIQVYSLAARKSYKMKCTNEPAGTTCKGAGGAVVYIT